MKSNFILNKNQIDYVIFHLKQHIDFDDRVKFVFDTVEKEQIKTPIIFIPQNNEEINYDFHIEFMDKSVPVIFPNSDRKIIYNIDKDNNLIFEHDFFKSAFYILSGFQEYSATNLDIHNRFLYSDSIQKKLNITHYPIVNYYFEMIISALEAFCSINSFYFKRKKLFDNFGFFLSHDVDRLSFYSFKNTLYRTKQLIGLAPMNYSFGLTVKFIIKGFLKIIFPKSIKDPWWNFDYLMNLETEFGIKSTFFFLSSHNKKIDSQYNFSDNKIRNLILTLESQGFEIGLHGSYDSYLDKKLLLKQFVDLSQITEKTIVGNRQHFLRFDISRTFNILENSGLKYDNSLAFAEIDGYRNGYCYPFHPYDFAKDRMLNICEIPLIMMEISVLNYQNGSTDDLLQKTKSHISEAKKFGGVFSLLWHNCNLMNEEFPGIEEFYPKLLKIIMDNKAESVTGSQIVKLCASERQYSENRKIIKANRGMNYKLNF